MSEHSSPGNDELESIYSALVQAQDCIRGETPEDVTDKEAREDTIDKIRDAMRLVEAMQVRVPAQAAGERLYTLAEVLTALEGAIKQLHTASSVPSTERDSGS